MYVRGHARARLLSFAFLSPKTREKCARPQIQRYARHFCIDFATMSHLKHEALFEGLLARLRVFACMNVSQGRDRCDNREFWLWFLLLIDQW
jgi:hypothetical protein